MDIISLNFSISILLLLDINFEISNIFLIEYSNCWNIIGYFKISDILT